MLVERRMPTEGIRNERGEKVIQNVNFTLDGFSHYLCKRDHKLSPSL